MKLNEFSDDQLDCALIVVGGMQGIATNQLDAHDAKRPALEARCAAIAETLAGLQHEIADRALARQLIREEMA